MKKSTFKYRYHRRKIVRYFYAEDFVLAKGLSVTKLNTLNDRRVFKLAKKWGWVDDVNCKKDW